MKKHLFIIAQKIGIDKAIAYTSGNGVLGAIIGVFSVVLYAACLSKEEQGYYYTFASVLALQVFFELGFTGVMTQFVAHERAHLSLNSEESKLDGDDIHKSRLSSLLHFCVKWYSIIAVLFLIILQFAGSYFFKEFGKTDKVDWETPWIIISLVSAWNLFVSPLFSFIYGLGFVKEIAKMGFYRTIINTIVLWGCLLWGMKLYSMAFSTVISSVYVIAYFAIHNYLEMLLNIWKNKISERVSYFKELFPFQWKIALSWISGYFIFNFMNPVIFATEGAVVAGQFGMTLTALNAIQSLALGWLTTKVPYYSQLIAFKDYARLDCLFNKTLKQMSSVCLSLLVFFFLFLWLLNITQFSIGGTVFAHRLLSFFPTFLLALPIILGQYVNSWATYLRCHKQEPYLLNSVVCGILNCLSTFILGNLYGLWGITIGYCAISLITFPWAYHVFKIKKMEWHGQI